MFLAAAACLCVNEEYSDLQIVELSLNVTYEAVNLRKAPDSLSRVEIREAIVHGLLLYILWWLPLVFRVSFDLIVSGRSFSHGSALWRTSKKIRLN